MSKKKKIDRRPMAVPIHPMAIKRLLAYLRSILRIKAHNFEPELTLKLKGLYFKYDHEFYAEKKVAAVAGYISHGIGFTSYLNEAENKMVTEIYGPGQIVLNPDSFFCGYPADTGLEFIAETNLIYVTNKDIDKLFEGFEESKLLVIKVLSRMSRLGGREKDQLHRLQGKAKVKRFFDIYPMLLRPARQAPMQYRDMASYLKIEPSHFGKLIKKLYPDLG